MKKPGNILATLIIIAAFALPMHANAQNLQNFSFDSFDGSYYLDRNGENDSTLQVKESLVAEFPNYDQNHGILRAIPQRYKNHTLSLKNISVVGDGSLA